MEKEVDCLMLKLKYWNKIVILWFFKNSWFLNDFLLWMIIDFLILERCGVDVFRVSLVLGLVEIVFCFC